MRTAQDCSSTVVASYSTDKRVSHSCPINPLTHLVAKPLLSFSMNHLIQVMNAISAYLPSQIQVTAYRREGDSEKEGEREGIERESILHRHAREES